jgi:hypothetical protein
VFRGCKDAVVNYYKAYQLKRNVKTAPLDGPQMRFVALAENDFNKIKPVLALLLLPVVGYAAPLYFMMYPNEAPSTVYSPAVLAHHRRVRAAQRVAQAPVLRKFLHLIADDYARRAAPPIVHTAFFKPEFAHKNPVTGGPAIAMNTTDSRAPKSMLQQLSEQRVARIKQEKTAAPTLDNSVKGIGSSINVKGSGHIDWKSYQSRPRRSLMEIIEQDRLANRHLSAEAQEQLIRQRIEDFNNHGDDPLMWDRARQRREKEKLDAERKARGEVEVEEDLSASKPVKAEDAYSTEIPIGLIDGDAPLSLQQLHAITPFFHYYITQYDLRANPLPLLQRFLRFWSLHEPCAPDQVPSDGKRLPMVSNIYDSYHLAQAMDASYRLQGVENLTHDELVEANYQRGMRWEGVDDATLQHQLKTWLDLQTTGEMFLPGTLLMYAPLLISPEPTTPEAVQQAHELIKLSKEIAPRKE